jgi:hypothetical protein
MNKGRIKAGRQNKDKREKIEAENGQQGYNGQGQNGVSRKRTGQGQGQKDENGQRQKIAERTRVLCRFSEFDEKFSSFPFKLMETD